GKEVPRERWGKPHPVAPGDAEAVLEVPGKPPVKESLTLKVGDKREVALDPNAAAPPPPGGGGAGDAGGGSAGGDTGGGGGSGSSGGPGMTKLRPFAFVAAGVGVAGLATFAIAGIMSNSTYSDLEATCKGPCPPELADDVSKGKTQQTIANIGLVVGAVGVAAAVPLFILSSGKKSDDAPPPAEASIVIAPGYLGLRGRF
ncbi:MAG TPA: tetratricopeptide repeat protein, partial [Polyangiaceae bacterium]|nr:tetratricopeptide repeat protein [Polyangiaceae bacterium]